jgi:hypothetical protein
VRAAGTKTRREIVGIVPDPALNPGGPSSADGVCEPLATNVVVLGFRNNQPAHGAEQPFALDLRPQAARAPLSPTRDERQGIGARSSAARTRRSVCSSARSNGRPVSA